MKLVVTDCDHDAFNEEHAVADQFGAELVFANATSDDEIVAAAADADGILVQYAQITGKLMDRLPKLRCIGRYGVGVDSLDVPAATARGIAICNVPDYGTQSVSDHAIALALALVRDIPRINHRVRTGQSVFPEIRPFHLFSELTFGVIGCGLIGSATAQKAKNLGFNVVVTDPLANGPQFHGHRAVSLDELLRSADVISIHTPLTAQTRHLLGAPELAACKPGVILVNTSRGPTIDTDALVVALQQGHIRAAGLDVLETEPIPPDHPLTQFENVTLTPHVAWYTEETYGELKRRTIENVATYLSGQRPRNILNPEVMARWTTETHEN